MTEIWTIGTSLRTLGEFIDLLKEHGIDLVVDVRRFPTSKFEHFKSENLSRELEKAGIMYARVEKLGGYRSGGYRAYMKTEDFSEGIDQLLELIRGKRAAIMCCEKLFFRCHRRFISDELVRRGIKVTHIVDSKRTYEHRVTP